MNEALLCRWAPVGCRNRSFSHLVILTLPQWENNVAITVYVYVHTNTWLCLCVFLQNKKRWLSPHSQPWPILLCRGGNRGSGVATGSAFELQEPPPSSCISFPSSLPHYSWKNGGLCSSHQLIPFECSRHGAHHRGQLTANPLFTELAM